MIKNIRYILFDLGGVLVELVGVPTVLKWMNNRVDEDELWKMWLCSPAIREFESGRITSREFAEAVIAEFEFCVDADKFIEEFIYFPKGFYTGVKELLEELKSKYTLAVLSNTNELHWDRMYSENNMEDLISFNFPSHKTGFMKPDKEAFLHVIKELECEPDEILFFDDNQVNVDAAQSTGMKAFRVRGFCELEQALQELKLI